MTLAGQERPHIPAQPVQAQQREHDVVDEGLLREQGEDLVGPRKPEMHALLRRQLEQLLTEQLHRTGVGRKVARHQIEERGLAGAVRADDQPPLSRHHAERDLLRRGQAAKALVEADHFERGRHTRRSFLGVRQRSHSCRSPGTKPNGMNMMTITKIAPSSEFQRSM